MNKLPTAIVLFGATGDLARRKLFPAIFDLAVRGCLDNDFYIVGFSRGHYTHEAFRGYVKEVLGSQKHEHTEKEIHDFTRHCFYVRGNFDAKCDYKTLGEFLIERDLEYNNCSDRLLYLAVPPTFYEDILTNLANSGLSIPCGGGKGKTQIVTEKPFGCDLETAAALDKQLSNLFNESQIFRIDHYLGKETLQNILAFRFSNVMFEPIWSNKYIERIEITLNEDLTVEDRGAFYDDVGALRDVAENHALQMLALITMEDPQSFDAEIIRKKRAGVLRALRKPTKAEVDRTMVKGQYDGYRETKGVGTDSKTETFFRITAEIDNARWRGVSMVLMGGKGLQRKETTIRVFFKEAPTGICEGARPDLIKQNVLTFDIQPKEGISVCFFAKRPGFETIIEPRLLSFSYPEIRDALSITAYQKLLRAALSGDQTLFPSSEEVEAAWRFVTPILKAWKDKEPIPYEIGGDGPYITEQE